MSNSVFEWFLSMLLLWNGALRCCCCGQVPLEAASVKGLRNVNAVVEWCLSFAAAVVEWFFRSRLLRSKGCAIEGCCCGIMCVLSSV